MIVNAKVINLIRNWVDDAQLIVSIVELVKFVIEIKGKFG